MDDHAEDEDLDDDAGRYYRIAYGLTRSRIEAADVRTFRRDAGKQLDQMWARVVRDYGDAGRRFVEAIRRGVGDAEAGRPPIW